MERSKLFKGLVKTTAITIIVMIVLVLLIVYIIPFSLSKIKGNDIAPVDDSQFHFLSDEIEEDTNMYYELLKIEDVGVVEPKELALYREFLNIENFKDEELVELFAENQDTLNNFSIAANLEKYQNPNLIDSSKVDIRLPGTPLSRVRAISRVSLLRSLWLLEEGYQEEAFREVVNSLKVGNAIVASDITTTEYLVGMALIKNSLACLQLMLPKIDDNQLLKEYLTMIKKSDYAVNDSYLKTEYLYAISAFDYVSRGEFGLLESAVNRRAINNSFYFKKNLTNSYYLDDFKILMDSLNNPCSENDYIAQEANFDFNSLKDFPKLYFTENAMGKILAIPVNTSLMNVETKRCQLKHKQILLEIEFGKTIYEIENKQSIETIRDLVPDYFDELPVDPLTGEEIIIEEKVSE